jgi:hypothetical protein
MMTDQTIKPLQADETDFCSLLTQLSLEEKVTLLSGRDFVTAAGVARIGIPPLKVSTHERYFGPFNYPRGVVIRTNHDICMLTTKAAQRFGKWHPTIQY